MLALVRIFTAMPQNSPACKAKISVMRRSRDEGPIPIRWRVGPPVGTLGTVYQSVRDFLSQRGGGCLRQDLQDAMESDRVISQRLENGQGFDRLLVNMRHSGEIELDGDEVRATPRALRRATKPSYPNATGEH